MRLVWGSSTSHADHQDFDFVVIEKLEWLSS
jgi:hypothetical protein